MGQAKLPVIRPISAWNKPLEVGCKELLKVLPEGIRSGTRGSGKSFPVPASSVSRRSASRPLSPSAPSS